MNNFKKIAKEVTTLSEVMVDRTLVSVSELLNEHIHIDKIDYITVTDAFSGKKKNSWVCAIGKEFFYAPTILAKVLDTVLQVYEGDIGAMRDDYNNVIEESDKYDLVITQSESSKGNDYYKCTFDE